MRVGGPLVKYVFLTNEQKPGFLPRMARNSRMAGKIMENPGNRELITTGQIRGN
jgi:hypothetical protein